jgi:hypothetical protein
MSESKFKGRHFLTTLLVVVFVFAVIALYRMPASSTKALTEDVSSNALNLTAIIIALAAFFIGVLSSMSSLVIDVVMSRVNDRLAAQKADLARFQSRAQATERNLLSMAQFLKISAEADYEAIPDERRDGSRAFYRRRTFLDSASAIVTLSDDINIQHQAILSLTKMPHVDTVKALDALSDKIQDMVSDRKRRKNLGKVIKKVCKEIEKQLA